MFDIYLAEKKIGNAQIVRKGLYYEITCRCSFPDGKKYRIHTVCADVKADLGLCVPFEGCFGFRTSVKIKSVGEGDIRFFAVQDGIQDEFVAVYPDKPFEHLTKLRNATLRICRGQVGITFPR